LPRRLALAALLALAAATAAAPARAETPRAVEAALPAHPVASDGRVVGDTARTRFVLDLDRAVDVVAFTLGDPYRVVIDLPQVRFALPAGSGSQGRGLVTGWRYGLLAIGRSRVVIDATGPVKIDKSFVLPSVDGQPARLVVDLVGTTTEAFRDELQRTAVEREVANDVPVAKSDRLPGPTTGGW